MLADDLGIKAGMGAHMKMLRRTWVGTDAETAFTLGEAHSIESLETAGEDGMLHSMLAPLSAALRSMPHYTLRADGLRRLLHGQTVSIEEIEFENRRVGACPPPQSDELAAILDEQDEVCAVVRRGSDALIPIKVLTHSRYAGGLFPSVRIV